MATQHIHQDTTQYVLLTPARHGPTRKLDRIMQKFGDFIMEQWATIVTVVLGILVFLAISVPFLSYFGLDSLAKPIFFALHSICAQIPSHSFYIFGHQLGFCERNLSIYTSMFIGSLIFVLSKKRLPGIPWWVWLLLILPMAWDGLTQMFGLRESDATLRVLTGSLFGLSNMWFALPLMHKTLQEPPPPQVPVQVRTHKPIAQNAQLTHKPIAQNTQLSGIERIAISIRSILPTNKQLKDSVHHSHTSSIYNQRRNSIYRVRDSSNNVSSNLSNISEE
jgi:uncharacterized membrane protein